MAAGVAGLCKSQRLNEVASAWQAGGFQALPRAYLPTALRVIRLGVFTQIAAARCGHRINWHVGWRLRSWASAVFVVSRGAPLLTLAGPAFDATGTGQRDVKTAAFRPATCRHGCTSTPSPLPTHE